MSELRPGIPNGHPMGQPSAHPQPNHHQPHPIHPSTPGGMPRINPLPTQPKPAAELDPIGLVEEVPVAQPTEKKIKAFGVQGLHQAKVFNRPTHVTGTGAVRVRTFHGKLSDQGMEYLDNAINDWLDHHPEVEVKFVTSSVGVFEGKIREPALILNLWY